MGSPQVLRGVLSGGQRVSLINCRVSEGDGNYAANTAENKTFYSYSFFFDYAVFGEHISHDQEEIIGVSFLLDDASIIFDDPAAIGFKRTADESIQELFNPKLATPKSNSAIFPGFLPCRFCRDFRLGHGAGKGFRSAQSAFDLPRGSGIVRIEDEVYVNLRFPKRLLLKMSLKGFSG